MRRTAGVRLGMLFRLLAHEGFHSEGWHLDRPESGLCFGVVLAVSAPTFSITTVPEMVMVG